MDHITHLQMDRLSESPSNPRRTFSEAALDELAASIRLAGVMSPIVVRPVVQQDIEHDYEIVFGHRRFRAAERAGLDTIPAIVRAMTDVEVARAQLHENMHRADVHPVEEAEAFARLMHDHGLTVDQLVVESGKSRSHIYGRLKLASMHEDVRAACIDDGLVAEVALLVARLPKPVQPEALRKIRWATGWASYRAAKDLLSGYCTKLTDNPLVTWCLADATMPGGACSTCPQMAGNHPALVDLDVDVCIDSACAATKRAEMARRTAELAATSASGDAGMPPAADLEAHSDQSDQPPPVIAMPRADDRSEWTPAEQAAANPLVANELLRRCAAALRGRERTEDDLRLVLTEQIDWATSIWPAAEALGLLTEADRSAPKTDRDDLLKASIGSMSGSDMGALLVCSTLWEIMDPTGWAWGYGRNRAARAAEIAARYGVDAVAVAEEIQTAKPAAPADDQTDEAGCAGKEPTATPAPSTPNQDAHRSVKYRNPATGETWSGRGLQPKWLALKLAEGSTLDMFATS